MSAIVVALHDQNPLFETAIAAVLDRDAGFHFIGHVGDGSSASSSIQPIPDIIIIESDGLDSGLVARLRQRFAGVKILLLCGNQDAQAIYAALQNGVSGCLSKRSAPDELIRAARSIANGEQYLSSILAMQLLSVAQKPAANANPFASLTDREEQIVKLLGIGLSNKEIGWRLTISEKTVKHYLTSILGKLNVRNRVQAALLAANRSEPLSYA